MIMVKKEAVKNALHILRIPKLRSWQKAPLEAILRGEDVLVLKATGGGKSLLFQLPAVLEAGKEITLVLSPLRMLQKDQVTALEMKGVRAALLNSDLSRSQRRELLDNLSSHALLYLAPEQLASIDLQDALRHAHISRVVVDEAHILPEAEEDFRQAYGKIGAWLDAMPVRPQVIALTATATPKARKRIITALGIDHAKQFIFPVRRENLELNVKRISRSKGVSLRRSLFRAVEATLEQWDGRGSVIIYAPTVKRAKRVYKWLKGRGWKARCCTGKDSGEKRERNLKEFLSGKTPIMVATSAFGLGIDKPDVRFIIHAGLPLTLEEYVQEIGRAGRDGKPSRCILFYSDGDYQKNRSILRKGGGGTESRWSEHGLEALKRLVKNKRCLWKEIEKYYGETGGDTCRQCSYCMGNRYINNFRWPRQ